MGAEDLRAPDKAILREILTLHYFVDVDDRRVMSCVRGGVPQFALQCSFPFLLTIRSFQKG